MKVIASLSVATAMSISTFGQGFVNLNFESAQNIPSVSNIGEYPVSVANALPGWRIVPNNIYNLIMYTLDPQYQWDNSVVLVGGNLALSGNYSVHFSDESQINQTAMVPGNAASLQFEAFNGSGTPRLTDFYLMLGGQSLSYELLHTGTVFNVYGANIPSYMDGQIETLEFGENGFSGIGLDNISFSTASVPEPSEGFLINTGAVFFAFLRLIPMFRGRRPRNCIRECLKS